LRSIKAEGAEKRAEAKAKRTETLTLTGEEPKAEFKEAPKTKFDEALNGVPMTGVGEGFTYRDAEEPKTKPKEEKPKEKGTLSLEGRAFDRERPMLVKTIAALQGLGIHFSYDLFRRRWHVGDHVLKEQFGDAMDDAILVLRTHITEKLGFDPRGHTDAAVYRLCLENAFNPVLDYLDSLRWDGKPRVDTWLVTYLVRWMKCLTGRLVERY
jgi:hypothetical protein